MTSGKQHKPTEIICERCGKTALWIGGRRKRFCSKTCSQGARQGTQPRKPRDPRSLAVQHTEKSRQSKIDRGQCVDCGLIITWHNVVCIDWDHRVPEQKAFTISYMIGRIKWEHIAAEINKCDAVCRNCHALRTHHNKHYNNKPNQNKQPNRGNKRPIYEQQ